MTTTHTPATLLALHDADPSKLRILACELRGWTNIELYEDNAGPSFWTGKPPADHPWRLGRPDTHLPPYSTSLDAVAELEAGLTDEEHVLFQENLRLVLLATMDWPFWNKSFRRAYVSAPAHLRLIAWVLTKQTI